MSATSSEIASEARPDAGEATVDEATLLEDLESGRVRAAEPDATAPGGWRVRPEVKSAILARFADRTTRD